MKIILDDTNPGDAHKMKILVLALSQPTPQAPVEVDEQAGATPEPPKKPKSGKKKSVEKKDLEPIEPAIVEKKPSMVDFKDVLEKHRGDFGIARTREIMAQVAGVDKPKEIPESQWGEVIDALKNDKGPSVEKIDMSDFE